MQTVHLDPKMVPPSLRGNYNGKQFKAIVSTSVTIPADAGLWSSGSRDTYQAIDLDTGRHAAVSDNMSAPWDNSRKDRTIELKPGLAVVRHTMFSGKDLGLTFYVHPDNAAKLLPAPATELTPHECCVLEATASLKSSYNGQNRFEMARDNCRYGSERKHYGLTGDATFPTLAEWEAAKQTLIAKGMLNKAGAITVAGRNARPSKY